MKYGLLVTNPISNYKNIGDYVQSLAAKQFLNDSFCYVEKEAISEFESDEPVKVIMNAWYMWHPECWPPKPCITPLLTSMHISPLTAKEMLANGGKEYLIEHGPVGCRDLDTKQLLDEADVPCYFSGCLTLTLGHSYKYTGERDGFIFVDPYIPPIRYIVNKKSIYYPKNILKGLWYILNYPKKVRRLVKEHVFFKARFALQSYYNAAMFYAGYSSKFEDDVLFSAEYLTHMVPVSEADNNESLLSRAEQLVKKYSMAKLVVTSRIHCGLPCLGLDTPVLFILHKEMEAKDNMYNAPGRFGGLLDFFNVMYYDNETISSRGGDFSIIGKIGETTIVRNKNKSKPFRDNLIDNVKKFISE